MGSGKLGLCLICTNLAKTGEAWNILYRNSSVLFEVSGLIPIVPDGSRIGSYVAFTPYSRQKFL